MKRVIEKGNLAFNLGLQICDICRRWNGKFTDDDIRICKYNKDKKGLYNGSMSDNMQNFKCKYYKRDVKYFSSDLRSKKYSYIKKRITKHFITIRGKIKLIE